MKKVEAKQARVVTDAIIQLLKPVQAHTLTITSDNGKEFSYHEEITQTFTTPISQDNFFKNLIL